MKAVHKIMLIKASITKINLAKKIFTMDVEQGYESYIPDELSIDIMAKSFWFYDPILQIVQSCVAMSRKDMMQTQSQFRL